MPPLGQLKQGTHDIFKGTAVLICLRLLVSAQLRLYVSMFDEVAEFPWACDLSMRLQAQELEEQAKDSKHDPQT